MTPSAADQDPCAFWLILQGGLLIGCVAAVAILFKVCADSAAGCVPMQDLHHPAMRDRHWKMLMQTTGKHFVMDEKFCLGDLLALGLHNYVDACRCVSSGSR